MKIQVICVGKTVRSYFLEAENEYLARLRHYCPVEKIEIPELKNARAMSIEQIKTEEGKLILKKLQATDTLILLDENGKEFDSPGFADHLQKQMNAGTRNLVFVVGGAYGFSEEVRARAAGKISLSRMTFSHQMVRGFFFEQLYRAFTILRGEPYHHQ
jgi:23S rRNA (pseudouridine1915-N3)-methyltransferase